MRHQVRWQARIGANADIGVGRTEEHRLELGMAIGEMQKGDLPLGIEFQQVILGQLLLRQCAGRIGAQTGGTKHKSGIQGILQKIASGMHPILHSVKNGQAIPLRQLPESVFSLYFNSLTLNSTRCLAKKTRCCAGGKPLQQQADQTWRAAVAGGIAMPPARSETTDGPTGFRPKGRCHARLHRFPAPSIRPRTPWADRRGYHGCNRGSAGAAKSGRS